MTSKIIKYLGFPGGSDHTESAHSVGEVGSIPRLGRPLGVGMATHSIYLPGEFHGQRSLAGHSPWFRVGHE